MNLQTASLADKKQTNHVKGLLRLKRLTNLLEELLDSKRAIK